MSPEPDVSGQPERRSERVAEDEAIGAAGFVFAIYRLVRWDEARDDADDIALYERTIAEMRSRWPWLDVAADAWQAMTQENTDD
jgi:hypothetical protein